MRLYLDKIIYLDWTMALHILFCQTNIHLFNFLDLSNKIYYVKLDGIHTTCF